MLLKNSNLHHSTIRALIKDVDMRNENGLIVDDSYHDVVYFDEYRLLKFNNVKKYKFLDDDFSNVWYVENIEKMTPSNEIQYYLLLDNRFSNEFAHWVYECAIYLPVFSILKEKYPNIKIVMLEKKGYNKLFMDYFNIDIKNDVIYIQSELTDHENVCFLPPPILTLNGKTISNEYMVYLDRFFDKFHTKVSKKIFKFLCVQKNDNSSAQDRTLDMSDICDKILYNNIGKILDTDNVSNLQDQIDIIRESNNIIISDESALFVNAMFARDSIIIACCTPTNNSIDRGKEHPRVRYLFEKIHKNKNNVIYLISHNAKYTFNDLINMDRQYDYFKFVPAILSPQCITGDTLILTNDGGFFSCLTIKLEDILQYFNMNKKLPKNIISNKLFGHYKKEQNVDVTNYFFKNIEMDIEYKEPVDIIISKSNQQFSDYRTINFDKIKPFIKKYFEVSDQISDKISNLIKKYNIDETNTCAIRFRGNDKTKETNGPTYDEFIKKANDILQKDPNVRFLVQTDEKEFLDKFITEFPNSIHFEETPSVNKCDTMVPKVITNNKMEDISWFLASIKIISKCKYIICTSGNGELWIALYRGSANNIYQYLNHKEYIYDKRNLCYYGPKQDYFLL